MNRVNCPNCGKEFKTESGRAYHLGWCKPGEPEPDDDQSAEDAEFDRWLNQPCGEPEPTGGGDEDRSFADEERRFWAELGLDPDGYGDDGPDNKASLLKQIQEQLELLECQDLLYVIGQRGIEEGARAILIIPGMREAMAFNAWADERNGDNPFDPVVENWFHVPGVREVIDRYQAEGRLQQATTVAAGQERQNRVDLVTQDIGQRVKDSVRRQRDGESPAPNNGWGLPRQASSKCSLPRRAPPSG